MSEAAKYKPEITRDPIEESIQHHEGIVQHFQKMKDMISAFVTKPHYANEVEWIDRQIGEHESRIKQLRGEADER